MAYGQQNQRGNYSNKNSQPARSAAPAARPATSTDGERDEPLFEKFVNTSKSGKALTLYVGDKGLTIPANTRIVISKLTDKQVEGLTRVGKERGFKSVPSHKLMVFKADDIAK